MRGIQGPHGPWQVQDSVLAFLPLVSLDPYSHSIVPGGLLVMS